MDEILIVGYLTEPISPAIDPPRLRQANVPRSIPRKNPRGKNWLGNTSDSRTVDGLPQARGINLWEVIGVEILFKTSMLRAERLPHNDGTLQPRR